MGYVRSFPGEADRLDISAIYESTTDYARKAYLDKYGIDFQQDPQWAIGGERHLFWLTEVDKRMASLIINPYQN